MRILTALTLVLGLLATGCGRSDRREYKLEGQVISMTADHTAAMIKHEEIPGFMAAMTMQYQAKEPKDYEGLVPGDLITATLVVLPTTAYLEGIRKVGNAPLERRADSGGASGGFELLQTGAPVPDMAFVNQDGRSVSLADFKGQALVVTFIYTSCPMPNFCPLMDRNFAAIQQKLKETNNALRTHLLSVSFDPQTDTPAVMKTHAQGLGADPRLWSFVTGDRDAIDRWAAGFGVSISRAMNDPRDITHNLRTALIDRQGNLVQVYGGNEWTPDQVVADIRVMVGID